MVRLEKLVTEQIFNIKALGRQRVLASPSKWYTENRFDAVHVAANKWYNQGITGTILRAVEPAISYLTWKWTRDLTKQRGLAMEDFFQFQERELRRDPWFESVARGSFHPYTWLFFKRRRARYYKVERGVRGFFVPDWVNKEAEQRTFAETAENMETYANYVFNEYMGEMTPTARFSVLSKWNPLDMIIYQGMWKHEAYDRYFFNEAYYDNYSQEEIKNARQNAWGNHNLTSDSGRQAFEREVNRFISLYPGALVPEGQQFDFQRFYARHAIANNKDTSRFEPGLVQNLAKELQQSKQLVDNVEGDRSGRWIGTQQPKWLQERRHRALQN